MTENIPDLSDMMADVNLEDTNRSIRSLPSFDFLDVEDPVLRKSILDISLPEDRSRMERYASRRELGIALVAAPVSTNLRGVHCRANHLA